MTKRIKWIAKITTYHDDLTISEKEYVVGTCTEYTIGAKFQEWCAKRGLTRCYSNTTLFGSKWSSLDGNIQAIVRPE